MSECRHSEMSRLHSCCPKCGGTPYNIMRVLQEHIAELTAIKDDYEDANASNKKLNNMVVELTARAEQAEKRADNLAERVKKEIDLMLQEARRAQLAEGREKVLRNMAMPLYQEMRNEWTTNMSEYERRAYAIVQALAGDGEGKV